jgi:hypothetical protein
MANIQKVVAHDALVYDAMKSSESSFARMWDSDEDAIYNTL